MRQDTDVRMLTMFLLQFTLNVFYGVEFNQGSVQNTRVVPIQPEHNTGSLLGLLVPVKEKNNADGYNDIPYKLCATLQG